MALGTLLATVTPTVATGIAYADEVNIQSSPATSVALESNRLDTVISNDKQITIATEEGTMIGDTIYEDKDGNVFTDKEVIVQKTAEDPRIVARSISASPISIGILWTYTTKADGTKLRDTFRTCATLEGVVGIMGALGAAGIATGGLSAVLAALVGIGTIAFHQRFTEGANLINSHPSSGKIYMYLDHCTYNSL